MTPLTQFMREAAQIMQQHKLAKVEDLLQDRKLLGQLEPTEQGRALLKDLRKFSAKGLLNEAEQMDREASREQMKKSGTRIGPLVPEKQRREMALKAAELRHK